MCFLLKKQRKMVFTVGDEEDFSLRQGETAQSLGAVLKESLCVIVRVCPLDEL